MSHSPPITDEVVLLVAHGARDPGLEGNQEVEHCAARWRARHPDTEIQVCWIEHAPVLLEAGLNRAAASLGGGRGQVLVLPLILNAASHVKADIPQAIAAARTRHPGVAFRYGAHLGTTDQLLKALRHRLHAAMAALKMPDPRTTGVVLLARGASDREATGEVAKMAHWLFESSQHELVMPAFTDCCFPRLEQVVQRLDALGASQIIVLPYYLFTGRLIKRIREQVARLRHQYPTRVIHQADHINDHDQLLDLLDQRLQQCRDGSAPPPCDGCALALAAEPPDAHDAHGHREPTAPPPVPAPPRR